jgi:hypothetical protein
MSSRLEFLNDKLKADAENKNRHSALRMEVDTRNAIQGRDNIHDELKSLYRDKECQLVIDSGYFVQYTHPIQIVKEDGKVKEFVRRGSAKYVLRHKAVKEEYRREVSKEGHAKVVTTSSKEYLKDAGLIWTHDKIVPFFAGSILSRFDANKFVDLLEEHPNNTPWPIKWTFNDIENYVLMASGLFNMWEGLPCFKVEENHARKALLDLEEQLKKDNNAVLAKDALPFWNEFKEFLPCFLDLTPLHDNEENLCLEFDVLFPNLERCRPKVHTLFKCIGELAFPVFGHGLRDYCKCEI